MISMVKKWKNTVTLKRETYTLKNHNVTHYLNRKM